MCILYIYIYIYYCVLICTLITYFLMYIIVATLFKNMEWVLNMMNRINFDVFTALNNDDTEWSTKKDTAFFRGRDSSQARLNLVRHSLSNPLDLDARLSAMFFFKNDSTLGELDRVSNGHMFQYRYIVNMDGTVAAYRLGLSLAGASLVMKQESSYYEHFYHQLVPGEHFLPLASDLSDFSEKLEWARAHSEEAKRIGQAGKKFLRQKLLPVDLLCYYGRVLEMYASKMSYARGIRVQVPEDFELVTDFLHADPPEVCECIPEVEPELIKIETKDEY